MTRPKSSAERFAQTATGRRTPAPSADGPAPQREIGHTAERTKPLRTTVDLAPTDHRRLVQHAARLAEDLDAAEIPRRAVWLALLPELDDPDVYARVRDRIRDARDELT